MCLAIWLIVGLLMAFPSQGSVNEQRQEWMYETYGIQFSDAQYRELEFPVYKKPSADREVYGLTTGNRDDQLITVQLIWEDGTYHLIGADGEQLEPLPEGR